MKNNLSDISFEEYEYGLPGTPDLNKLTEKLPIPWVEFRKTLKPRYFIVWRDVAMCYLLIAIGIFLSIYTNNSSLYIKLPLVLALGVWIGFWFHSLSLFLHEAVHYNIHKNRKLNDILTDLIICPFIFINVNGYRKIHWHHHTQLGTTKDTEKSYFNAPNIKFILETLTGIHAIRTLLIYFMPKSKSNISEKNENDSFDWKMALRLVITQSIVILIFVFFGYYFTAVAWVLGIVVFWPFFGTVRQILRHRGEYASAKTDYYSVDHGAVVRMFGDDLFSKSFGAAGFNKHMLHHWDPHISYTRIDDMEEYLRQTELGPIIDQSRRNYFRLFKNLFFRAME